MKSESVEIGLWLALAALILVGWIHLFDPFQTAIEKGQIARARADTISLSTALTEYKEFNGFFPSTSQGLGALITKPSSDPVPEHWTQLLGEVYADPWGHAYQYTVPGKHNPQGFDVYTTGGPRGEVIGNW